MSVLHLAAIRKREMCVFVCEMEVILCSRDDSVGGCLGGGEQVFPASGSHHVFQLFPNSGYDDQNMLLGTTFSYSGSEPSGMLPISAEELLDVSEVKVPHVTFVIRTFAGVWLRPLFCAFCPTGPDEVGTQEKDMQAIVWWI